MEALTTPNFSPLIEAVRNAKDADKAVQLVKQIDALKVALESVYRFRAESIKYAVLECEALLRVVELGGVADLRAPHRKTAEWLATLTRDELNEYVAKCHNGITIDEIYKYEVELKQKTDRALKTIKSFEEDTLKNLKETGIANLKDFSNAVRSNLRGVYGLNANDLIDGARNRLLKAGAVGVGHDSGIYVIPKKANETEIHSAICCRYNSIAADIAAVRALANACGIRPTFEEITKLAHEEYMVLDEYSYDTQLIGFMETIGVFAPKAGETP